MTWAGVAGQGVAWHGSKTSNLSALLPLDPCSGWTASQGQYQMIVRNVQCSTLDCRNPPSGIMQYIEEAEDTLVGRAY